MDTTYHTATNQTNYKTNPVEYLSQYKKYEQVDVKLTNMVALNSIHSYYIKIQHETSSAFYSQIFLEMIKLEQSLLHIKDAMSEKDRNLVESVLVDHVKRVANIQADYTKDREKLLADLDGIVNRYETKEYDEQLQ